MYRRDKAPAPLHERPHQESARTLRQIEPSGPAALAIAVGQAGARDDLGTRVHDRSVACMVARRLPDGGQSGRSPTGRTPAYPCSEQLLLTCINIVVDSACTARVR